MSKSFRGSFFCEPERDKSAPSEMVRLRCIGGSFGMDLVSYCRTVAKKPVCALSPTKRLHKIKCLSIRMRAKRYSASSPNTREPTGGLTAGELGDECGSEDGGGPGGLGALSAAATADGVADAADDWLSPTTGEEGGDGGWEAGCSSRDFGGLSVATTAGGVGSDICAAGKAIAPPQMMVGFLPQKGDGLSACGDFSTAAGEVFAAAKGEAESSLTVRAFIFGTRCPLYGWKFFLVQFCTLPLFEIFGSHDRPDRLTQRSRPRTASGRCCAVKITAGCRRSRDFLSSDAST